MSSDGRYVVVVSNAPNIVPGFAPTPNTAYRIDRTTGAAVAVSVSPTGGQTEGAGSSNAGPEAVDISDDGRYVVFSHRATNLAPGAIPSGTSQVYLRDIDAATTVRVSQAPGVVPSGGASLPRISGDGRWVTFVSASNNLGPTDTNGLADSYRWNRLTGELARVSVGLDSGGNVIEANGATSQAVPANDGRVVFASRAKNLLRNNPLNPTDDIVYVADPATRAIDVMSKTSTGAIAPGHIDDISPDGRFLVFQSGLNNVVPGDTDNRADVFVWDDQNKTVELAIHTVSGGPATATDGTISPDGRYVVTRSDSDLVLPGDTTPGGGAYLRDRQTGQQYAASRTIDGTSTGNIDRIGGLSADGRTFLFDTSSPSLVPGASGAGTRWSVITRTPVP